MNRITTRAPLTALLLLLGLGATGCTNELIANTARSSLSSFLTTLASTAINHVVNPN